MRQLSAQVLNWAAKHPVDLYAPGAFSWTVISHHGDKSKDLIWTASTFPDLLGLFEPEVALRALDFLTLASGAETTMVKQLAKVRRAAELTPTRPKDKAAVYAPARAEFWRRAERTFWDAAVGHADVEVCTDRLRVHALAGFDIATSVLLHDWRTHMLVVESRRWIEAWSRRVSDNNGHAEEQSQ